MRINLTVFLVLLCQAAAAVVAVAGMLCSSSEATHAVPHPWKAGSEREHATLTLKNAAPLRQTAKHAKPPRGHTYTEPLRSLLRELECSSRVTERRRDLATDRSHATQKCRRVDVNAMVLICHCRR
jgi:hypothetical protein